MDHFFGVLKRVFRFTVLRNAKKLDKSLQVTSMPVFFVSVGIIKKGKDMHGGGGMKDKEGRIAVNEKDCRKLWEEHMEKILNAENEWDQMAEADMVEGPVEGVTYKEVMKAMNKMKLGKAAGPSEGNMDMIMASEKFGVRIKKLCERIMDGEDWPEEWKTSVNVPIFKGKGV